MTYLRVQKITPALQHLQTLLSPSLCQVSWGSNSIQFAESVSPPHPGWYKAIRVSLPNHSHSPASFQPLVKAGSRQCSQSAPEWSPWNAGEDAERPTGDIFPSAGAPSNALLGQLPTAGRQSPFPKGCSAQRALLSLGCSPWVGSAVHCWLLLLCWQPLQQ